MELEINVVLVGDALQKLKSLPDKCVRCIVTSPPYFNLRDYKMSGQIGMEKSPEAYIIKLVEIFRECRRILTDDGTLWVNIGDSYASKGKNRTKKQASQNSTLKGSLDSQESILFQNSKISVGLKEKDLIGIPWLLAFALRSDGWYLRSDIVWAKKNCMPESVEDRPTRSHEYIFLLSKSKTYYYNHEAIKEPSIYDVDGTGTASRKARQKGDNKSMPTQKNAGIRPTRFKDAKKMNGKHSDKQRGHSRRHNGFNERWDQMTHEEQCTGMRNKRDVWNVATAQFPEAHFAVFPEELILPCILAGSEQGDIILDPFLGSGTTALLANKLGRNFIGIELNPEYAEMAKERIKKFTGVFTPPTTLNI
jgi:DNA modification methylase